MKIRISRNDGIAIFLLLICFIAGKTIYGNFERNKAYASDITKIKALEVNEDDIIIGKKDAKHTIVEYIDFTCYHCSEFHKKHFHEMYAKYFSKGTVKNVFRILVLSQKSLTGAKFLFCDIEKNRSEQENLNIISVLFSDNWKIDGNYTEKLKTELEKNKINTSNFYKCMNSDTTLKKIMLMRGIAIKTLEIPGTPFVFFNGKQIDIDSLQNEISKTIK